MITFPDPLLRTLPALYSTEGGPIEEKILRAKWLHLGGSWSWYALEGEPEGDDFLFFGLVVGFETEWGYFLRSELEAEGGQIERDTWFKPCTVSELQQKEGVRLK